MTPPNTITAVYNTVGNNVTVLRTTLAFREAFYTNTSNLNDTLLGAMAEIAAGANPANTWEGFFTLEHAPCNQVTPPPPSTSITKFEYTVSAGPAIAQIGPYTCTLEAKAVNGGVCPPGTSEATVTVCDTNTFRVSVQGTNNFGTPASTEKLQGGLAAMATYSNLTSDCGATINISQSRDDQKGGGPSQQGNVVTATVSPFNPPAVCNISVDVTKQYTSCGQQPVTSSWSEVVTVPDAAAAATLTSAGYTCTLNTNGTYDCKSPYTGRLSVKVVPKADGSCSCNVQGKGK